MAYLDDNNENLTSMGDPLEKLDRELAELRATLEQMDADGRIPDEVISLEPEGQAPDEDDQIPDEITQAEPTPPERPVPDTKERKPAAIPPRYRRRNIAVFTALALIALAVLGGIGFGVYKMISGRTPADPNAAPTASGEVVTINDSEMGEVTLQTVKGAQISTYSAENLVEDENGYYAYYENGQKISHLGVDLSEYQGEVDFEKVRASGVEFVILRIGGRFYGDAGKLYEDGAFDTYYEQAKAAGLKVGAYYFSQATSVEDAQEEAAQTVKKLNGRALDYPVAFDWENIGDDEARTDGVTGGELTQIAEAFCDFITDAGYKAIVYANSAQMFVMYDFETMKDYDFWLADYREFPTMYYNYNMWQYAADGKVDGIDGDVDMNISFKSY